MKPFFKLPFGLAAAVTLALAGTASAHDGHGWGGGGWHGGGHYGRGYYRGGFALGFYPGFYGPWGYPYPYYYPYAPGYYAEPPYTYRGEVAPGSDSVEANVERALADKGYYQGKIDGIIGPMARDAIRDYQRDKGQPVTGDINERLLRSLDLD